MSKYEKMGSLLLFDKFEEDKDSKSFVAGQIQNNQIQQIRWVKKFDHSISAIPDFVVDMTQELEVFKGLSNPALIRPGDVVSYRSELAAVFDYFEGKSLREVLARCTQEGYPFTADHALLIASRACAALEYLHSKKVGDQRLVHGFLSPDSIFVTYDGETKVLYLGLAHVLLKNPQTRDRFIQNHKNYLAPEVIQSQKLDKPADVFSAGLVLFEMLTGEALFSKGRDISIPQIVDQATMHNNSGDKIPVPDEIKKALLQALSLEPASRFASIAELRKVFDQQLFSSDSSPTTFNLAFFMNSLFRENMDEEGKNIKNLKKMDISSYLKEEPPPKPVHPVGAEPAKDMPVSPVSMQQAVPSFGSAVNIEDTPKEKSKTPLFIGLLIALAVIGGAGYFLFKPSEPATTQQQGQLTPEQQRAAEAEKNRLQREAETAQAEAKKKDDQLKELQARLDSLLKAQKDSKAGSTAPAVDPAAIQQLQQQARQLEEERKRQEDLAQEKLRAAAAPPTVPSAEPPPPETKTEPAPTTTASEPPASTVEQPKQDAPPVSQPDTPTPQPATTSVSTVKEGDTVEPGPDVVKPELVSRVQPAYPPVARTKKVQGTVILSLLVTEKGDVSEVKVLREAGGSSGLNEAAVASARKWKFRPAVKEGKRVKVWVTYPVSFKLEG